MIYQLLQRDAAWKLSRYMIVGFALAGFLAPRSLGIGGSLLMLGCLNAGILQTGYRLVRSTLFYAALPISGRQLFLARAISCLSLAAVPFLAAAAGHALARPGDVQTILEFLAMGAVFAFFALCGLSLRIEEFQGPMRLTNLMLYLSALAYLVNVRPASALPVLCIAIIGCIVRWVTVWRRVPAGFQTASFALSAPAAPAREVSSGSTRAWWVLSRTSISWQAWMMIPALLAQAMFINVTLAMLIGFGIPSQIRLRTRWLAALPMAPRALLALILVPYLLPLAGGYAVAARFGFGRVAAPRIVDEQGGWNNVEMPLEYWRRAPGGVAPVSQSPWGETFQPPITSVLGVAVYNPYACGPASSEGFRNWQYARGAEAIYGEPLTLEQVADRRRLGSLRPIAMGARGQILGTGLLLGIALSTQLVIGLGSWRRTSRRPMRSVWTVVAWCFFVLLGIDLWSLMRGPGLVSVALFNSLIRHMVLWAPQPLAATIAIAALMALIPYALLEQQFRESEMTSLPPIDALGQRVA